eukprot:TRINITY_DN124_c0_g1_i3.p2 TRINITY_DN124_c0_g1~~TRINITY_DN124_c0_g1_i3.p2  ORF type:complete len:307 (-),score=15.32 TRINITY_DN124_c0_g1_i3:2025-2945(-)
MSRECGDAPARGRCPKPPPSITSPMELCALRERLLTSQSQCFRTASITSLQSVIAQWSRFHEQLLKIESVDEDESFLLWLQKKKEAGLQPQSAMQYLTYWNMAHKSSESAYRRSLMLELQTWEGRQQRMTKIPKAVDVIQLALRKPYHILNVALAAQWSLACRHSELLALDVRHVQIGTSSTAVTFVGTKTDLRSEGQTVMVPTSGCPFRIVVAWIQSIDCGPVFPALPLVHYNRFLKKNLGTNVSSQMIRHAALSQVARLLSEDEARHMARHRSETAIRHYTSQLDWNSTRATSRPAALLQNRNI